MSRVLQSAAALALAASFAMPARADSPLPPSIAVTGEASISVAPDLAEVEGGVTSEARTAREATDATNKAMGAVIAALKAKGVAEADIRTSHLLLQPQSAPRQQGGTPQITGYRASNSVTVRVHEIAKLADTIDTLLASGANEIDGIGFMVSKASALLDDVRPKAIADARRKAEIYAKAAGVAVGPPISISEEGGPMPLSQRSFKAAPMAAPTPVSPGEERLTVTVSVAYEIKPANP